MGRNDWAWTNKARNKDKAIKQTALIDKNYAERVNACIQNTIIYDFTDTGIHLNPCLFNKNKETVIEVANMDSVNAAKEYLNGRTAILNFASFKNPGGMFINGSMAQEEALCHSSILYNVLRAFEDTYYKENHNMLNNSLYEDRALYSKDILFKPSKDVSFICDVLTCAAPNAFAAKTYKKISSSVIEESMKKRIQTVLYICAKEQAETLILGAFGCGVFGNDPTFVAKCFKEELENDYKNVFNQVIFAIPGGKNLKAFQKIFCD